MKKNKKNNILIVVAHTDDETIGCAGTIQWHNKNGHNVYVMSFTDGVSSRSSKKNLPKQINDRFLYSRKAEKILNFKWIKNLSFPDNELDKVPLLQIIKQIELVSKKIKPVMVYTHSMSDLNIDHRMVAEATLTAFRPDLNQNCKEIRLFETPSSTDFSFNKIKKSFSPNIYVDISKFWKKKKIALEAYKSEIKKFPHSRSLKGIANLAKLRGSQSGVLMA